MATWRVSPTGDNAARTRYVPCLAMKHLEQIAAMLFADDAHAKTEKILASLITDADARGGAVLLIRAERLVLFSGQGLPLSELSYIETRWSAAAGHLISGQLVQERNLLLAPLSVPGSLVGVLVLDAPRSFDLADTELPRGFLARALVAPATTAAPSTPQPPSWAAPNAPPRSMPAHEQERLRLVELLERHEWNVSLVARKLGVTRRTVYMRIERYGIERQVVPRLFKRTPATG